MRLNRNLAMILLAVFLILFGLESLIPAMGVLHLITALCALAAGILMLVTR